MIVSAHCEFEMAFVRINGIVHLMFNPASFVGLNSWYMTPDKKWVIEIVLKDGLMTPDYATKKRWEAVLVCLESALCRCKDHTVEFDDTKEVPV